MIGCIGTVGGAVYMPLSEMVPQVAAAQSPTTLQVIEAGTARELPTNERKLLNFLGLEQLSFDFMHELDFLETPEKPEGELRAALHMGERVVATQSGILSGHVKSGQRWSCQNRPTEMARD
jgi:hypothetical protein